jgi:Glycosyl transferase family 2
VADGADIRDLIRAEERVRLIHLDNALIIGEKRNFACSHARGEVIAHWDDDDWSEPQRLEDQIKRLINSKKAVTGYHSMYFTDGHQWWEYQGAHGYAIGTSLCYRRSWWQEHPFQPRDIGEDNYFVSEAGAAQMLTSVRCGPLMYATIHRNNTSPRMLGESWRSIDNEHTRQFKTGLIAELEDSKAH